MATLALDKCGSCGKPVSTRLSNCMACGWDSNRKERQCLKCERLVVLNNGLGFSGISGGLTGTAGFVFFLLFGALLGMSITAAVSTICGFISVFTLGHKCVNCGKIVIAKNLTKDERDEEGKRRVNFLIGSIVMAAVTVALFFLWLSFPGQRHRR